MELVLNLSESQPENPNITSYKVDRFNGNKVSGIMPASLSGNKVIYIQNNHTIEYLPNSLSDFLNHAFLTIKGGQLNYNIPSTKINLSNKPLKVELDRNDCYLYYHELVEEIDKKYKLKEYLSGDSFKYLNEDNPCKTDIYEFIKLVLSLLSDPFEDYSIIQDSFSSFLKKFPDSKLNNYFNGLTRKQGKRDQKIEPKLVIINYKDDEEYDDLYDKYFKAISPNIIIVNKKNRNVLANLNHQYDYVHVSGDGDSGGYIFESKSIVISALLEKLNLKSNFKMIALLYCNYYNNPKNEFPDIAYSTNTTDFFSTHIAFLYSYGFAKCFALTGDYPLSNQMGILFTFSFNKSDYKSLMFRSY